MRLFQSRDRMEYRLPRRQELERNVELLSILLMIVRTQRNRRVLVRDQEDKDAKRQRRHCSGMKCQQE